MTDSKMPEPVAWESTTLGYIKYVTDERYRKFSTEVQRWYKPYRCSHCADLAHPAPVADAELEALRVSDDDFDRGGYWYNRALDDVAALRALPTQAPAVKLKQLQWLLAEDGDFVAETSIGDYILGFPHRSWNLTTSAGSIFSFHTIEEAKAAAQADYEQRILSALLPEGGE